MTTIDNLIIAGVGLSTMGGIVYGSYELLKDVPKPVTELLRIKQKELIGDNDKEAWDQSWQKYIEDHTRTEEVEAPVTTPPNPEVPAQKVSRQVINTNDAWGLLNGWSDRNSKTEAPQTFKDKCKEKYDSKQVGIWTKEYKNFEKYCTKDTPVDD